MPLPGADLDIEEGGGHAQSEFGAAVQRAQPAQLFARANITQSVVEGSGACLPRKIFEFKPYESASEAIGDYHNHARKIYGNWTVTLAIRCMVASRSPFPSESTTV